MTGSSPRVLGLAAGLAAGFALWAMSPVAHASPAVDGSRNLGLGNVARGSSYGTNAVLLNPSNMGFSKTFAIEPMYQVAVKGRTHGFGIVVMDSLNNSRVSLGLGYVFMGGKPQISYVDGGGTEQKLELSRFGHEAMVTLGVMVVKDWLAVGVKPKYQYTSLRYRDSKGVARNAQPKLNAFGLDVSLTANFADFAALALVGTNVTGNNSPGYTDAQPLKLENLGVTPGTINYRSLSPLSDYPLGFAYGVSVFPLRKIDFSINHDGYYDFSSYRFEKATRMVYGGSAEFVAGPVPLRFGTIWDSRGKGKKDDRVSIAAGVAYVRPAPSGSVGVDVGVGFQQQVTGSQKETILGINLGIRLHPDL